MGRESFAGGNGMQRGSEEREEAGSAGLAERIAAGDRAAEAQLVERFRRGVTVIARRACGDAGLAEDVAQEVVRVAIERIRAGSLREPDRLPGFVAGLARNLAVDADRRRRARGQHAAGDAADLAVPAPGPSPLQDVLDREQSQRAREVLDEVAIGRDREILRRVYLNGDAREDVCRELGLSRLQLARILFRARERFRALWMSRQEER